MGQHPINNDVLQSALIVIGNPHAGIVSEFIISELDAREVAIRFDATDPKITINLIGGIDRNTRVASRALGIGVMCANGTRRYAHILNYPTFLIE